MAHRLAPQARADLSTIWNYDAVQAAMTLWVEHERRRTEILAAVDIAKTSIDRGDGIEITRESMRALAEDVKRRGRAKLAGEKRPAR